MNNSPTPPIETITALRTHSTTAIYSLCDLIPSHTLTPKTKVIIAHTIAHSASTIAQLTQLRSIMRGTGAKT